MKKLLALIPLASLHLAVAQVRDYDPSVQPVDRIQYFKDNRKDNDYWIYQEG